MSCLVSLVGKVSVGGGDCGCSGSGGVSKQQPLDLGCNGTQYAAVVSTDCPTQVQTTGVVGAEFVDLPGTDGIGGFQLLVVKTQTVMRLRIGGAAATLLGSGASFPTGFSGGESLTFEADGVEVDATFTAAAQSAVQVAQEINQAAIGAGLTYLPATVDATGQLRLSGRLTGSEGTLEITGALAALGFASPVLVVGAGSDVDVNGAFLAQFDSSAAPARVQISGNGRVEVLAAGMAA